MFLEERHTEIVELLNKNARVTTAEIQEKFNVSYESARRDLRLLEQKGLCKRTHGGAVSMTQVCIPADKKRKYENMTVYDNYREISKAACQRISENDIVYITSGSFGHIILSMLSKNIHCTIVVNSVDMGKELREFDNVDVYIVGGKMRQSGSLVDSFAVDFVSKLHFDLCFVTGSGVTSDFGLSNGTDETAAFQRAVIKNSRKRVLLMPGAKVGLESFVKVCNIDVFDEIITDWECNEEHIAAIEEKGVKITVAEQSK